MLEDYTDYIKIDSYQYRPPALGDLGSSFNFVIPTSDSQYQSIGTKDIRGTVLLPMPQSLPTNSQGASWGEGKLDPLTAAGVGVAQEGIEGGVGGLAGGVSAFIDKAKSSAQTGLGQKTVQSFFATKAVELLKGGDQNLFGELLSRNTGAVINENVELLFRGATLRDDITFQFELVPRDDKESQEIRNMILFLKKEMSPRKGTTSGSGGGLFLTAPSVFKIQYMSGKKTHSYLNRFKMCALANLSLNFTASNTYTTYSDGTPVHMQLTLTFKELTPIYAEDYESKEGISGVGY
jgi:hypothetical protein